MTKFIITTMFLFSYSFSLHALNGLPQVVSGKIRSFDSKLVVIESGEDLFEIPRDLVAQEHLKSGSSIKVGFTTEMLPRIRKKKIRGCRRYGTFTCAKAKPSYASSNYNFGRSPSDSGHLKSDHFGAL